MNEISFAEQANHQAAQDARQAQPELDRPIYPQYRALEQPLDRATCRTGKDSPKTLQPDTDCDGGHIFGPM